MTLVGDSMKVREEHMEKREPILEYEQSVQGLVDYFGCDDDFFMKLLLPCEWTVKADGDFYFLSYWQENGKKTEAVIVKKSGEPLIYEGKEYTMVVAIDCVKIGFIFRNEKRTEFQMDL